VLGGLALQLEVLLRELPGGLDGLAAADGEEHLVQVAGRADDHPLGQFDRGRVSGAPQREVREFAALLGGGLGQLLAAVADLDGEQPGQPVEVPLPVGVPHVRAVAAHDHRRRGHPVAVPGEVHPEVVDRGHAWLQCCVFRWKVAV
jgi:hypothetical protein